MNLERLIRGFTVAGLVLSLAACSAANQARLDAEEKPETFAIAGVWHYSFDSLEGMIATSDLVVLGEVTAIRQGRLLFPQEVATSDRLRDATITISEILKGEYTGSTLVIEEQGYLADGTPYELTEMPWSQIGDVGVFFLKHSDLHSEGYFGQIHPDGRILTAYVDPIDNSIVTPAMALVFSHTPFGERLGSLDPGIVRDSIVAATETVVSESIAPHKPIWELLNDDTELIGTGGSIGGENPQPGENTQPGGPQDDPIEGRQTQ